MDNIRMKAHLVLFAIIAVLASIGCNMGNAPAPMSDAEVGAAINKMTPEQRIHFIQGSPDSPAEKARKIAEIRKQYNLPEEAGKGAETSPGTNK